MRPPSSLCAAGLLLSAALVACMPYEKGSFQSGPTKFPAERSSLGCLDLGIQAAYDAYAEGPVLDLYLGNRCNDGVWVDFTALRLRAELASGEQIDVGIFDPNAELRAVVLGGREAAVERLEVEAPPETVALCADLDDFAQAHSDGPALVLCTRIAGA